jgi:glycerol uptake facilitator protein
MAVMVGVFVAISAGAPQADINPAVTIGKWLFLGVYGAGEAILTMIVQVLGALVGGIIVWLAYLNHWAPTEDADGKLAVFCTAPAIRNTPNNFITELIGTMVLLIGVGAIFTGATNGSPAAGLGPYLVGALVWGIGLSLGGPTGYAINPARDLGPRIAHMLLPIPGKRDPDWSYGWIPVVAPLVGGALGGLVWNLVF